MMRCMVWCMPVLMLVGGCDVLGEIAGWPPSEVPGNGNTNTGPTESGKVELEQFESEAAFKAYFTDQVETDQRYDRAGDGGTFAVDDADAAPTSEEGPPAEPTGGGEAQGDANSGDEGGGDDGFSTTTTQEEGVQEGDIVKNDGTYVYVLSESTLHIVQADPGEALAELASLELEGYGRDLYLLQDHVVALTRPSVYYDLPVVLIAEDIVAPPGIYRSRTQVTVVDVTDRSNPVIESTSWFEGDLSTSRMIGDMLHLVLVNYPNYFSPFISYRDGEPVVADVSVEEILPDFQVAVAGDDPVSGNTVGWDDVYYPFDPDGYGMTTVVSLDINTPEAFKSAAVVAYPGNTYASTQALYLTDAEYDFFGGTRQTTDIYKVAFSDSGPLLTAVGAVPGRILNQYSMSEYQGYLRVATTIDRGGFAVALETPPANHVYVLAEEGEALNIVGRAENIAPNEEIRSARFSGERGFLVTFERTDPLFTLDMSNPRNPQVIGKLKVPGFSTFIMEMGEDHLLTIGQDAPTNGMFVWPQGVQLSIFDISDFSQPRLAYKELIGNPDAWSEALYNPKALTYYAEQDLLAVPVEMYNYGPEFMDDGDAAFDEEGDVDLDADPANGDQEDDAVDVVTVTVADALPPAEEFQGVMVYRVTPEAGFELLGQLPTGFDAGYYYSNFTRGVFMQENVFAVTDHVVAGAPVADVNSVPWVILLGNLHLARYGNSGCLSDYGNGRGDEPDIYPDDLIMEDDEDAETNGTAPNVGTNGTLPDVDTNGTVPDVDTNGAGTNGYSACSEDDLIDLHIWGYTVDVVHVNATYNCCPDEIAVTMTAEDNVIRMTEEEVLTSPCRCTCCYEVYSTLEDIKPGAYTLEYCWYDYETGAQRCQQEDFVIP
ncbi:MAG: hypothetical protein GY842_08835 [bacterium]|nr:hypothetical protein [bacterium]